ncbi:ABC transporter ATP-binding protein [Amycolatopsis sp. NPDC006131]|uniref:ABC transporter ATP-binding protein n=1 Tax=Amycolatopsis sp. NPDC006131 TaxID=3156731 RepID=UPI00339F5F96
MADLLELQSVSSGYGDLTIVRDVSFSVAESSVTVLLGPNGAGKTTLLRTIAGLNPLRHGSIAFAGRDLGGLRPHRRQALGLGFTQENKRIFKKLTVEQNLLFGAVRLSSRKRERQELLAEAYARFPILGDKRKQTAGYLSGGQQQMLAISMALVAQPSLVMLDEPFSGLAPSIVNDVMETVRRLRSEEGRTLLIVEQAVDLALALADSVLLLDVGRLVHQGPADEPGIRSIVESTYFGAHAANARRSTAS